MAKQPLRLITFAWGERYIEELFALTLPAVLAPNNLPALAQDFACEVVILTEAGWFERLRRHPVYGQLRRYGTVEFRAIDDLINQRDAYGVTLTYALFRGFEDLGPAMVDRHLIFFNADFILADGSLRTVGQKILAGERLILSPSYCVVAEAVTPWLTSRKDPDQGVLAVPPREMAAMALRHRHNTIRGKTVNQPAFSVEWMDQFYWLVDEHTLLAHQMPFAVVSMRPERVLTEMRTFWDYGIISEACPTTPRCVISDSDEFLMIELRSSEVARGQLSLGWPEPKQIADKLKQFITRDPVELARHTLVLHSADLPAGLDEAKARLDAFVDAVLAELPAEPTHWVDHPIWANHYRRFHEARQAYLAESAEPGGEASERQPAEAAKSRSLSRASLVETVRLLYRRLFGRAPWLRPLHPRWADVQPALRILREQRGEPVLVVSSAWLPERLFDGLDARHMDVAALGASYKLKPPKSETEIRYRSDRGVSDGENSLKPAEAATGETYGLCILELNHVDLADVSRLIERVAPSVRPGGRIVVCHLNPGEFRGGQTLIGSGLLWLDRPYAIEFVGSAPALRSIVYFHRALAGLRRWQGVSVIKGLVWLAAACLFRLGARAQRPSRSGRRPVEFTSLTLAIEVSRSDEVDAGTRNVRHAAE